MTLNSYLFICKRAGLFSADLDDMTIGMCMDYADYYFDEINPDKKEKVEAATQDHFDNF